MNKKTIYIIVAVLVIIIVVAGAAAFLLMNTNDNNGNDDNGPTPTPTATATTVGAANSITFSANITSAGSTVEYKWAGTNIHAANITIRTDFSTYSYILNATAQKSWLSTNSGAKFTASDFNTDWVAWDGQFSEYVDALIAHWTGTGDYTFQNGAGETVVLYNIAVNPTIPAATFTPTL